MLKYFNCHVQLLEDFWLKNKFVSNDLIVEGKLYLLLEGTKLLSISLLELFRISKNNSALYIEAKGTKLSLLLFLFLFAGDKFNPRSNP